MDSIIYRDREITGERLDLTSEDGNYYLGPNLTLTQCTVVIKTSPRWLHIGDVRLRDCVIEVKRDMKNFQEWKYASLIHCKFTGRIPGCEFGGQPSSPVFTGGHIESCDFSQVRLSGCRFHRCDLLSLRLPPWPCFTLVDPLNNAEQWRRLPWPERFKDSVLDFWGEPPSTLALTYHAPTLTKQYGTTPEEIRPLLEEIHCIL